MTQTQPYLVVLAVTLTVWSKGNAVYVVRVVPDLSQCQGSSGPCRTLAELQNQSSNPITQSETTWEFFPGTHTAHSAVTAFVNASNIALQCGMRGQERDCVISCPPKCVFTFVNCTNVTVQGLNVTRADLTRGTPHINCSSGLGFSNSSHFYCPSTRAWVLERVENANIREMHFSGSGQLAVLAPRGRIEVSGCCFTGFPPADTLLESHSMTSPVAVHVMGLPLDSRTLTLNINKCRFERVHFFPKNRDRKQFTQHAIKVTVHSEVEASSTLAVTVTNCVFLRGPAVDVNVTDRPRTDFRMRDCFLDGEVTCLNDSCQGFPLLHSPGVRVQVITGMVPCSHSVYQTRLHVNISGTMFTRLASYEGTGVHVVFSSANSSGADSCCRHAVVALHGNTFRNNWGLRYGSVVYAKHLFNGRGCPTLSTKRPAFIMDGNIIDNNVAESARCNEFEMLSYSPGHSLYVSQQKRLQDCQPNDHGQGAVFLKGLQGALSASYHNNSVYNNTARGVFLDGSQLVIWGSNHVINNSALFGGGLYLHHQSQLVFTANSSLNMSGNRATFSGGGMYVSDDCYKPDYANATCRCFFELLPDDSNSTMLTHTRVLASGNTAHTSGNLIYVSTLGQCTQSETHSNMDSINLFRKLFNLTTGELDMQDVSSFPQQICLCNSSGPVSCSLSAMDRVKVYPGQKLQLCMQVLGDQSITLQTQIAVHAAKDEPYTSLREFPPLFHSQILHQNCNSVLLPLWQDSAQPGNYTLLFAVPHHPNALTRSLNSFLIANLTVQLLHDCPPGFSLSIKGNQASCECQTTLVKMKINCLLGNASVYSPLDSVSFTIPRDYWLGQGHNGHTYFSERCPPAYCNNTEEQNQVWLARDNLQCLHGREGLLCGNCPKGLSVVFGSPRCSKCTNYSLLLIIAFAVLGPALIGFFCFFNFTISTRSINGLFFYISVVSINIDLFPVFSNSFASSVVSVLNLDIGFECFYDGMTIKDRTLLSFVFPLYLLLLVALLIAVSHCVPMHKVNKRIGPRITPVLATVIFLSHTKLFNAVVKILLWTYIWDASSGQHSQVWRFDGTLPYFKGDHLVLAAIALVTMGGLLLPVTVIAVAGDLFRRCIHNRWYMNFLDTFHGSFRFKLGFWIGLRLVLRMILFVLKVTVRPEIVQLVTVCIVLTLAVVQSVLKPFRHLRLESFTHPRLERWCTEEAGRTIANTLDISFLVNLVALFVCLSYKQRYGEVFLSLSLLVVLLQLLLILFYHLVEYSPLGQPMLRCLNRVAQLCKSKLQEKEGEGSVLVESDVAVRVSQLPLVLDANNCTDESYESSFGSTVASTESGGKAI